MTPLRQKMIEDLRLRGMAKTTERTYVAIVAQYARRAGRSPADLDFTDVRALLLDLRERGRTPATLAQYCPLCASCTSSRWGAPTSPSRSRVL